MNLHLLDHVQAFEFFVNLNNRSPEFISLFLDDRLRKGMKGMSDGDIDVVLDKVMCIFRCVDAYPMLKNMLILL